MVACPVTWNAASRPERTSAERNPGCHASTRAERSFPPTSSCSATRASSSSKTVGTHPPTLDGITFEGKAVDPAVGIVTGRCLTPMDRETCKDKPKFDVIFNDASAETDPSNVDADGHTGRGDPLRRLVHDEREVPDRPQDPLRWQPRPNAESRRSTSTRRPSQVKAASGPCHDNRGGTTWLEIPLEIK